jgi:hypothetical protein
MEIERKISTTEAVSDVATNMVNQVTKSGDMEIFASGSLLKRIELVW